MIGLLRALHLCAAISTAHPEVPRARACSAASAIVRHHGAHDPLLLAAILVHESRLDPGAVNSRTGACGLGQALYSRDRAVQARRCRAILGSVEAGVRSAVERLDDARAFAGRGASILDVLAGYTSGPRGVRGGWYRMPRAILRERDRLRRALGGRPGHLAPLGAGS